MQTKSFKIENAIELDTLAELHAEKQRLQDYKNLILMLDSAISELDVISNLNEGKHVCSEVLRKISKISQKLNDIAGSAQKDYNKCLSAYEKSRSEN